MNSDLVELAKPCCCFHPPGVHVDREVGPLCISCAWLGLDSWFPPSHPYVPEPELLPVVPKPKPGDPPWDMRRERLDLLFGIVR